MKANEIINCEFRVITTSLMALPEGTVEVDARQPGTGYFYIGNTIMLKRF